MSQYDDEVAQLEATPIIKSEATLQDALGLLSRTLRKCRIDPVNVVITIPDFDAGKKLESEWGLGERICKMCGETFPNVNQFIARYRGFTIIAPAKE
jgi:hypothetical protein